MPDVTVNTAGGQPSGTVMTTGNAGFDQVSISGGVGQFDDSQSPPNRNNSTSFLVSGNSDNTVIAVDNFTPADSAAASLSWRMSALPTVACAIVGLRNSSGWAAKVVLTAGGKLSVIDATGTSLYAGAVNLNVGTWYRIGLQVTPGTTTSNGDVQMYVTLVDDVAVIDSFTSAAANVGTTQLTSARWGKLDPSGVFASAWMDDCASSLGATAVLGPALPDAPTSVTATADDGTASIAFTAPAYTGYGTPTYTATSSPGGLTASGASPITITGLTDGTAYTFTVHATNSVGDSAESSPSSAVTPTAAVQYGRKLRVTGAYVALSQKQRIGGVWVQI